MVSNYEYLYCQLYALTPLLCNGCFALHSTHPSDSRKRPRPPGVYFIHIRQCFFRSSLSSLFPSNRGTNRTRGYCYHRIWLDHRNISWYAPISIRWIPWISRCVLREYFWIYWNWCYRFFLAKHSPL